MVPLTNIAPGVVPSHESINELPVNALTHPQHFVPVSESRAFTRVDAGAEFGLPPADKMIPHPELITEEREKMQGVPTEERRQWAIARESKEIEEKRAKDEEERRKRQEKEVMFERGRWRWRIRLAETGKVGYRYGIPHEDRKKGQVKIPTRVE